MIISRSTAKVSYLNLAQVSSSEPVDGVRRLKHLDRGVCSSSGNQDDSENADPDRNNSVGQRSARCAQTGRIGCRLRRSRSEHFDRGVCPLWRSQRRLTERARCHWEEHLDRGVYGGCRPKSSRIDSPTGDVEHIDRGVCLFPKVADPVWNASHDRRQVRPATERFRQTGGVGRYGSHQ
jgi:hypothetical protein